VLDAYGTALASAAPDTQVLTVTWGVWQHDAWQQQDGGFAEQAAYRHRYGFTDEAGCATLERLIGLRGTVVALRQRLPEALRAWTAFTDLDQMLDTAAGAAGSARFPRPPLRADYVAPRSPLEHTIADTWGNYLGIDRIGIHDPFFDLGGNSLVGTAMVTAIERLLQRRIAPALLFAHPTVAAFAAALDGADRPEPTGGLALAAGSARGTRRRRAGAARPTGSQK
jgi:hypothetical protein